MIYGEQIKTLLTKMTAQPPRTASDLLDYAALMLWRRTSLYDGGDPCEALNDAGAHATIQDHSAYEPAWAVFSLAADRTEPARRAEWKPPVRWDPKELAQIIVAGLQSDRGLGQSHERRNPVQWLRAGGQI